MNIFSELWSFNCLSLIAFSIVILKSRPVKDNNILIVQMYQLLLWVRDDLHHELGRVEAALGAEDYHHVSARIIDGVHWWKGGDQRGGAVGQFDKQ